MWYNVHLEEKVEALKEHPVEAGEVEEVGEGEGCAENLLGDPGGRQVVPGEGENPVEGGQAKGGEQTHVDLVPQTSHLPGMENRLSKLRFNYIYGQTIFFPLSCQFGKQTVATAILVFFKW